MNARVIGEDAGDEFRCLCCERRQARWAYLKVPDYFVRSGILTDYVRCTSCGTVQQFPLPDDVSAYYTDYPVHARGKSRLHETMRRMIFKPLYFNPSKLSRDAVLLDYGCGDGWFLDSASAFPIQRMGFEYNTGHAAALHNLLGVPVYSDVAQLRRDWAGRVDQITLHFVVEHLTDLRGALAMWSDLLKPGGRVYAVYPNLACPEFRWFGSKWHGFDAPRHIVFPGAKQMEQLANEQGMTLERAGYAPFPNTLAASLSVALTGRFRMPLFLAFLPLGLLWTRFNQRGTYAIELRKRG